jgi:16S rRNA (adenine1518-N6/adenine1519-N6)-dimethyltransferase
MQNSISRKIKDELDQLGIKPKKSLGQNFLVNEGVYKKIVAALEIKKDDIIVEVGPGLGTLTGYLAESKAEIVAVEKDEKLAAYLKSKLSNRKNVKIIEGDILKFNPGNYQLQTTNYKLVGNIPYYLSSHLIRVVFEKWPRPEKIVLMLQKEVAQRIVAKPPNMSLLAVSVQYYSKPEIVSHVSAGSFYPPPEVDSAIIKLVPSEQFTAYGENTENCKLKTVNFFKVVRAGFAGKRKQLANTLATGLKISKQEIQQKLSLIDVDPRRRAETLTIKEWQKITNFLFSQG